MLTDIFAERYANTPIWNEFGEAARRLVVQGYKLLSEEICPYWVDGKESQRAKAFWTGIHGQLAMELGLQSLSPLAYAYNTVWAGQSHTMSGTWTMNVVCENWMLKELDRSISADRFVKERLSLVELGFRRRGEEIATANAQLPERLAKGPPVTVGHTIRLPGDYREGLKAANAALNAEFIQLVDELNTRFRQAGCNLHYHNGHIQLASDVTLTREVERPFWNLLGANQTWANVDTDVKEAIDRRDRGERDPAFCAARALESTIKIISNEKGWTSGRERGAHNYIDNLRSGQPPFLAVWEAEALKQFFSKIRNPLGHGAGASAMPALTAQQTDWAIGVCMLWIRSLVRRM